MICAGVVGDAEALGYRLGLHGEPGGGIVFAPLPHTGDQPKHDHTHND